MYLAETLSKEVDGYCVTSIVNTLGEEITIDSPFVELEEIENGCDDAVLIFSNSVAEDGNRLSKLCKELRTDHLNGEERVSLINICKEYKDVFYLPGDKLTFTTAAAAAEYTIPTPTIDPTRGINTKRYRIHEVHREEVQKQTEQMLRDGIIESSNSPWNSPILVIPNKADSSVGRNGGLLKISENLMTSQLVIVSLSLSLYQVNPNIALRIKI